MHRSPLASINPHPGASSSPGLGKFRSIRPICFPSTGPCLFAASARRPLDCGWSSWAPTSSQPGPMQTRGPAAQSRPVGRLRIWRAPPGTSRVAASKRASRRAVNCNRFPLFQRDPDEPFEAIRSAERLETASLGVDLVPGAILPRLPLDVAPQPDTRQQQMLSPNLVLMSASCCCCSLSVLSV